MIEFGEHSQTQLTGDEIQQLPVDPKQQHEPAYALTGDERQLFIQYYTFFIKKHNMKEKLNSYT